VSDANPNQNANANTRKEKRTPVTLKIKFKSATLDQFIERYSVDVSHGGIFIRTKDPLGVGTHLKFEFQLQDASPLIAGEGTVVWTREHDPSRVGVAPGMGVRFDRLTPESRPVLEKILAQKGGRDASLEPKFEPAKPTAPIKTPAGPTPKVGTQFTGQSIDEDFDDGVFEQPTRVAAMRDVMKQRKDQEDIDTDAPTIAAKAEEGASAPTPPPSPLSKLPAPADAAASPPAPPAPPAQATTPASPKWVDPNRVGTLHGVGPVGSKKDDRTPTPAPLPKPEIDALAPTRPVLSVVKSPALSESGPVRPLMTEEPLTPDPEDERQRPTEHVDAMSPPGADELPAHARELPTASIRKKSSSASFVLIGVIGVLAAAGMIFYMQRQQEEQPPPPRASAAVTPETSSPAPGKAKTDPAAPPSAARPVAPPAAPKGVELAVTSDPAGATVEIDGVAHAQATPATLPLPLDKKVTIVVKRDCYAPHTVELDPAAAGGKPPAPLDVKLKALPRVIDVATTPAGATVVLDGKAIGATPRQIRLQGDPLKSHTLAVRKVGYTGAEQTVGADSVCVSSDGKTGRVAVAFSLEKSVSAPVAAVPPPAPAPVRPPREKVDKPPVEKPPAAATPPAAETPPPPAETPAAEPPPKETPPAPAKTKPPKPPAKPEKPPEEKPPAEEPPKETPPSDETTPDWMK
jgi:uncharacterized protein (TIGR02266 family)